MRVGRIVGVLGVACALASLLVAAAVPAALAADPGAPPDVSQSELEHCIGTVPLQPGQQPPSCTFDANGHLISRSTGTSSNAPPSGAFVLLAMLAVAWSIVPFAIAISIARSRGEPVGGAVLLTLVLGWIGLVIVAYGQRRAVSVVRDLAAPAGEEIQSS